MENNESGLVEITSRENVGEELRCKVLSKGKLRGKVTFETVSSDLNKGIDVQRIYTFLGIGLVYRDQKHYESEDHFEINGLSDVEKELEDIIGSAFDVFYFGQFYNGNSDHSFFIKPSYELDQFLKSSRFSKHR